MGLTYSVTLVKGHPAIEYDHICTTFGSTVFLFQGPLYEVASIFGGHLLLAGFGLFFFGGLLRVELKRSSSLLSTLLPNVS